MKQGQSPSRPAESCASMSDHDALGYAAWVSSAVPNQAVQLSALHIDAFTHEGQKQGRLT
jgi:hypothetical protein